MNRQEIKLQAKQRLRENKWNMVIVCLIYSIITGIISGSVGPKITYDISAGEVITNIQNNTGISGIVGLLTIFVLAPLGIGVIKFFRNNIYQNENVETIKDGFTINYFNNVITMAISTVIITIGTLFFIIPGIIFGLGFTLVPYILIDNPQLGVGDTLKLSWEKMRGHKMDYFMLQLSFIGWILLSILTLGIVGILFAFPYMSQAGAIFCDRILGQTEYIRAEVVDDFTGFER